MLSDVNVMQSVYMVLGNERVVCKPLFYTLKRSVYYMSYMAADFAESAIMSISMRGLNHSSDKRAGLATCSP